MVLLWLCSGADLVCSRSTYFTTTIQATNRLLCAVQIGRRTGLMTRFRTPVSKRRNGLLELMLLRVAVRKLRLSVRVRVVWEAESII